MGYAMNKRASTILCYHAGTIVRNLSIEDYRQNKVSDHPPRGRFYALILIRKNFLMTV
jgi:hypothetical protein